MITDWSDYLQKLFSIGLGMIGTWLALRNYYERRQQDADRRQQDTEKRHQETLDRYALAQQKEYAAERDFEHLKRNQEQMKNTLQLLDDELTETRADFKELKGMLMVIFGKSGETISGIFAHKEKRNESV